MQSQGTLRMEAHSLGMVGSFSTEDETLSFTMNVRQKTEWEAFLALSLLQLNSLDTALKNVQWTRKKSRGGQRNGSFLQPKVTTQLRMSFLWLLCGTCVYQIIINFYYRCWGCWHYFNFRVNEITCRLGCSPSDLSFYGTSSEVCFACLGCGLEYMWDFYKARPDRRKSQTWCEPSCTDDR